MGNSVLRDATKIFAKNIITLVKTIRENNKEFTLTEQILRAGTSIGANVHEAQYAQGRADFISKLEIALKECYETEYWLELLFDAEYINEDIFKKYSNECGTIRRRLISSCNTAKGNY